MLELGERSQSARAGLEGMVACPEGSAHRAAEADLAAPIDERATCAASSGSTVVLVPRLRPDRGEGRRIDPTQQGRPESEQRILDSGLKDGFDTRAHPGLTPFSQLLFQRANVLALIA